jgi:hypothetical protein
MCRKF